MHDIWKDEESFWLGGADTFEALMARECLMVFGPMGIMTGKDIPESLRQAPRWVEVDIGETTLLQPTDNVLVLAYRVIARRQNDEPYKALCSSTYVDQDGQWKIVQHQQTPL